MLAKLVVKTRGAAARKRDRNVVLVVSARDAQISHSLTPMWMIKNDGTGMKAIWMIVIIIRLRNKSDYRHLLFYYRHILL